MNLNYSSTFCGVTFYSMAVWRRSTGGSKLWVTVVVTVVETGHALSLQ